MGTIGLRVPTKQIKDFPAFIVSNLWVRPSSLQTARTELYMWIK